MKSAINTPSPALFAILIIGLVWTSASFAKGRHSEGATSRLRNELRMSEKKSSIFKRISVFAGGSAGTFTTPGFESQFNIGFSGGATIDIGARDFVFETGLTYLEMGMSRSLIGSTQLDEIRMNLNYVGIPLNAKYYFYNSDSAFFGRIGVIPLFQVSSTGVARYQGKELDRVNIETNKNDVIGTLGLGGHFRISSGMRILLEGNALLGAISIDKDKRGDTRNVGMSLLTGLVFDLN
ncbi:MAG: PorT family protein [Bdellovibrionales bacterium]|nr:PorT family protein [Bdellovibrionales bacterium]